MRKTTFFIQILKLKCIILRKIAVSFYKEFVFAPKGTRTFLHLVTIIKYL